MAGNDQSSNPLLLSGRRFYLNWWYLVDLLQVDQAQRVGLGHCQSKQLVDVTDYVLGKAGAMPTQAQLQEITATLITVQLKALANAVKGVEH
jgi:hypothetical protein